MAEPTPTPVSASFWTLESLHYHWDVVDRLRREFSEERDRRYTEVNIEREKALKIKETADLAALGLAREIQTYKDEKANQLREQINSERGIYATKEDLASAMREMKAVIEPLHAFVLAEGGGDKQANTVRTNVVAAASILGGTILAVVAIITVVVLLSRAPPTPVVVPATPAPSRTNHLEIVQTIYYQQESTR